MPKRVLTGTVVSDKGDKTVVVRVERRVKHPLYGKIIKLSKKYHAHDAANEVRSGEIVRIVECAPISKLKAWTVLDRIGAAKAEAVEITEPEALSTETQATAPGADKAAKPAEIKAGKPAETAAEKPTEQSAETPAKPTAEKPTKAAKKPTKKAKADDVADADA